MLFEFEDYYIDAIHEKYAWRLCDFCIINDKRLQRFFPKTLEQNLTPDLSKYFIERKIKQFQNKEEFLFVLKEKKNHTLIGIIYVKEIDWKKQQAELAYAISHSEEGKGYMTQTVEAISKWAYDVHHLKTLQIIVHQSNKGSIRVAEKNGYVWQKLLKAEHKAPGEPPLDMELFELYL